MQTKFDVIIIGGSYSGLSAALSLGRSLRKVLVIDSGKPCNRFTPHSHNFITHDGHTPAAIAEEAREQIMAYKTVTIINDLAISASKNNNSFVVATEKGLTYTTRKILFATGVKDELPQITGLKDCWGISAIHCPYCHGYEYNKKATGIVANADMAYHYALLVNNLTDKLFIFTNGVKNFTDEQTEKLKKNKIPVYESALKEIYHNDGYINKIVLEDQSQFEVAALYVRPNSTQHTKLPEQMGCTINEQGLLVTDIMQKTNVDGIYASGDCCTPMRSVAAAVAQGTMAGAGINAELCTEDFN